MKQYIFLLRVNKTSLSEQETEQRTRQWGLLIPELTLQGKFIAGWVFENDGYNVYGSPKRIVAESPVCDHNEIMGGVIIIEADDLNEAIEISKRCPTINFGGSVEVRQLQLQHHPGINN